MKEKANKTASRAMRSKARGRIKIIPTRSHSVSLRNSKQRETFVSLETTSRKKKDYNKTNRLSVTFTHPGDELLPESTAEESTQLNEIGPKENVGKENESTLQINKDLLSSVETIKVEKTGSELSKTEPAINKEIKDENVKTELPGSVPELPVKRKRGRPRKSESTAPKLSQPTTKLAPMAKKIKKERTPTPPLKQEDSPPSPPAARRKPRMASLNAIAKVNAVLENYRFEKMKANFEKQAMVNDQYPTKTTKSCGSKMKEVNKDSKIVVGKYHSKKTKNVGRPKEQGVLSVLNDDSEVDVEGLDNQLEEDNVFVIPSPQKINQSIQTDFDLPKSKFVQTEVFKYPNGHLLTPRETVCTCCPRSGQPQFPTAPTDFPLHVRSSILAKNPTHTLAIPIIKTHVCSKTKNNVCKGITDNISLFLDRCINRTLFHKTNYPECNQLRKLSEQKDALEKKRRLAELTHQRMEQKKNAQRLVIPSLDCEPISISIPVSNSYQNGLQSNRERLNSRKSENKTKIEDFGTASDLKKVIIF